MKGKKEFLILAVVIVALCAYLYFRQSDQVHYSIPVMPAIDTAEFTKVELAAKSGAVTLEKNDGAWRLNPGDFPADAVQVERMLKLIGSLTLTDLVSESENYSRYDLTDEGRITVKAYAGTDLTRDFAIGKAAPSYRHTYVMIDSDKRVYQAREDFRNAFLPDMNGLRDKKIWTADSSEVGKVSIVQKGRELALTRQEARPGEEKAGEPKAGSRWTDQAGREVSFSDADTLVSLLSSLECEVFLDDVRKEDLKSPEAAITLTGTKDRTLYIYPKQGEHVPAASPESPYVFVLPQFVQDDVNKALQSLMGRK